LFKQISEENLNILNNRDIQPRFNNINKVKKVATMSMSKSMSDMNIAENASNELLNQVNENFQIDFEPINILAAQFQANIPRIVDD